MSDYSGSQRRGWGANSRASSARPYRGRDDASEYSVGRRSARSASVDGGRSRAMYGDGSSYDGWQAGQDAVPASARSGHEIPGYTGFIPCARSGNIFGKTFRETNWAASMGHGSGGFGDTASLPGTPRRSMWRAASEPKRLIPGYTGYIPGGSENVVGLGPTGTHERQLARLSGERFEEYAVSSKLQDPPKHLSQGRAGSEIPGYVGYLPGVRPEPTAMGASRRVVSDLTHRERGREMTHRPDYMVPVDPLYPPPMRTPRKAAEVVIPGYTGHVPGGAENVHGKIQAEAIQEQYARLGFAPAPQRDDPRTPRAPQIPSMVEEQVAAKRMAVAAPGYAGYVPGKRADNIIGKTSAAANAHAIHERFHPAGKYFQYAASGLARSAPSYAGSTPRRPRVPGSASSAVSAVSRGSGAGGAVRRTAPGEAMRAPSLESLASSRSSASFLESGQHYPGGSRPTSARSSRAGSAVGGGRSSSRRAKPAPSVASSSADSRSTRSTRSGRSYASSASQQMGTTLKLDGTLRPY